MLTLPDEYNTLFENFRPLFSKTDLAACLAVTDWGDPCSRKADRLLRAADHGLEPGEALSKLSSCLEPSGLVEFGGQCDLSAAAAQYVFAYWPGGHRDR
jgi:hypothetical protein